MNDRTRTRSMLFSLSESFRVFGWFSIIIGIGVGFYVITNVDITAELLGWSLLWVCGGVVASLPAFNLAYLIRLALHAEDHLHRVATQTPSQEPTTV